MSAWLTVLGLILLAWVIDQIARSFEEPPKNETYWMKDASDK